MRTTMVESLAGTAIIQTSAFSSDGGGGGTTTWTASGTVSCRVAPAASAGEDERVLGGRVQPDTQYVFTLPAETSVTEDDRIVYDSRNFTVTMLREPQTWEISRRIEVKEVK